MTVKELSTHITGMLAPVHGRGEAEAMTRVMFEHLLGYSPVDLVLNSHRTLEPFTVERFERVVRRVVAGEPLQYVLGTARFMGMDFDVTPATLIPRPETQGLVDMIVDDFESEADLRVLDIGTGTGCIAIALARALKFPQVTGVDISQEALEVARRNAARLSPRNAEMIQADALNPSTMPRYTYNIIVSNPPYIALSESVEMEAHVLDHEPHSALFVPDNKPLLFYEAIAHYAINHLAPAGKLYFEINPRFVTQLMQLMRDSGFENVEIRRDYLGRERFLTASM